ncbi:hypothetical protein ACH5RR_000729 [Cinchona calisaya]|uniref:Zinc finger PMZ-type domain-containing protein n=1 Tax=Cinchona calisaya TaxID=153742 RepID=A0ABD3B267_9GENT
MLEDYAAELLIALPDSTMVLKTEGNEIDRFQRIYIFFEVLKQGSLEGDNRFVVDLPARICSHRKWQLTGIPCSHVVRRITDNGEKIEQYLSHYYTREMFLSAYEPVTLPIAEAQTRERKREDNQVDLEQIEGTKFSPNEDVQLLEMNTFVLD